MLMKYMAFSVCALQWGAGYCQCLDCQLDAEYEWMLANW